MLIQGYNESLAYTGYEIKQYECKKNVDGTISYMILYLGRLEETNISLEKLSQDSECAKTCKQILKEEWEVTFDIKVYG